MVEPKIIPNSHGRHSDDCKCSACFDALARIDELEAAMAHAHGLLGSLSMATEGALRVNICTAYNIIGVPLGKGRSVHGRETRET